MDSTLETFSLMNVVPPISILRSFGGFGGCPGFAGGGTPYHHTGNMTASVIAVLLVTEIATVLPSEKIGPIPIISIPKDHPGGKSIDFIFIIVIINT